MRKKPIKITIKQDSKTAKIFQAAIEQKDTFRHAVEEITAARNTNTSQPQRVQTL